MTHTPAHTRTITITNPRTIAIIEQEAAERGVTPAEAVDHLLAESMPEQHSPDDIESRKAKVMEFLRGITVRETDPAEAEARHERINDLIDRTGASMDPARTRE